MKRIIYIILLLISTQITYGQQTGTLKTIKVQGAGGSGSSSIAQYLKSGYAVIVDSSGTGTSLDPKIYTVALDTTLLKDTTLLYFPLRATLDGKSQYIDTFNLKELRYSLSKRITGLWTDTTLIDKKYADSSIAAAGGGGISQATISDTLKAYATGGSLTTDNVIFSTPIALAVANHTMTGTFALKSQSPYTLFGRGAGSGAPSFLSAIDSNWVTGLHSEAYYNTKYLGGGGSGNTKYVAQGYGAKVDSSGSLYTVKADSSVMATKASYQTLTNKRWVPRIDSTTSSATPTINTDNVDIYKITAQTGSVTSFTTNLTGTPYGGEILEIQVTGTSARSLAWGAAFVSSSVTLPVTTVSTKTLTVIFQYYKSSSYGNNVWLCVNYY